MPKPGILFKAAALMVRNNSPNNQNKAVIQVMCKDRPAINIQDEAAALLLDYLLIARAFFCNCEEGSQKLNDFCANLMKVLHSESNGSVVNLPEIRQIITEMGCLTDWERLYPSPDF